MTEIDTETVVRKLAGSPNNRCFACGPANPHGLHLRFERTENGGVKAAFAPREWHQGWEGVVHGGVLATLLDEAMAYVVFFSGFVGLTARMEVRYRAPVRGGDVLTVEAEQVKDSRRIVDVVGRVRNGNQVVVEANGRFMKLRPLEEGI
jgi:uncharacterized protein (TIGR00369 family)